MLEFKDEDEPWKYILQSMTPYGKTILRPTSTAHEASVSTLRFCSQVYSIHLYSDIWGEFCVI